MTAGDFRAALPIVLQIAWSVNYIARIIQLHGTFAWKNVAYLPIHAYPSHRGKCAHPALIDARTRARFKQVRYMRRIYLSRVLKVERVIAESSHCAGLAFAQHT